VEWLTAMLKEHALMIDFDHELKNIEDRIARENALIYYAKNELRL
jgi:hypothetical protein